VVRLGENAIRVRLGATQQAGPTGRKAYALLPRTHTISLLVLIPRPAMTTGQPPHLGIVAHTSLKEVDRGKSLALSRTDDFKERFEGIAAAMNIDERIEDGGGRCPPERSEEEPPLTPGWWVNRMRHEYVVYGDYDGFFLEARCMFSHGRLTKNEPRDARIDDDRSISMSDIYRDIEDLWHSLMGATGDYAVSAQSVHLPAVFPPELPEPRLTVLLQDDGKSTSVAHVPGSGSLTASRVKAELYQEVAKGPRLAARSVEIDSEGVIAKFPSLQQLGLAAKGKPASAWYIKLVHPVAETDRKDREIDNGKLYCSTQQEASGGLAAHGLISDRERLDWPSRTCWQKYGPVLYVPAETRPEAPGNLIASVTARKIVTAGGVGSVTVGLQVDPGVPARSAYVKIEGAEITAVSGGEVDDLGRLKVPTSGRVTLTLRNAAAGGKVTLRWGLFKPDGSKEEPPSGSHELDVVASDAAASSGDTGKPAS
jgi:hypothetical protein